MTQERMSTSERVINDFGFHPATDDTRPRHEIVRRTAAQFALQLIEICPEGRELSLALTNLQQAAMWANAAIAVNLAPLEK